MGWGITEKKINQKVATEKALETVSYIGFALLEGF